MNKWLAANANWNSELGCQAERNINQKDLKLNLLNDFLSFLFDTNSDD